MPGSPTAVCPNQLASMAVKRQGEKSRGSSRGVRLPRVSDAIRCAIGSRWRAEASGKEKKSGNQKVVRRSRREVSGSTSASASAPATPAINNRGNPVVPGEIGVSRRKHGTLPSKYSRVSPSTSLILAVRRKLFDRRTFLFFFRGRERLADFAPISILNRDVEALGDPRAILRSPIDQSRRVALHDRTCRGPCKGEVKVRWSCELCRLKGTKLKERKAGQT